MNISNIDIQGYIKMATDWAVVFVPNLILAILVIFVGLFVVKRLSKGLRIALEKANMGVEITDFLSSLLDILMKALVFLFAASFIGFEISTLLGVLAAAGFAVGLALQGFLGNFASGLTILFFKPYRVTDWVKVSDHFGKVTSIQIFNTTLETPNNKTLIIPNGQVTDNIITNFSTMGKIRLELNVSMPYEESFPKVKSVIESALNNCAIILKNEDAQIGIEAYDSHNITVAVRPYIDPDDYWNATFEVYSAIKKAFSENGIQAAYSEGVELGKIGN
jgi:small conductance mechanosensitive channel